MPKVHFIDTKFAILTSAVDYVWSDLPHAIRKSFFNSIMIFKHASTAVSWNSEQSVNTKVNTIET